MGCVIMSILKNKLLIIVLLVLCFIMAQYTVGNGNAPLKSYRLVESVDGERLIVPDKINSYATLLPSYTETLIDLGLENNLVVADEDSNYLLEYSNDVETIDIEKLNINEYVGTILEQQPDIILLDKTTYSKLSSSSVQEIENNGSQIIVLPIPKSIDEIRNELRFLVDLTQAKHGDKLLTSFDMKYSAIQEANSKVKQPVPVFFQVQDNNADAIATCGNNTYINDMIKLAGGKNVFDNKNGVQYTSFEEIARKNPQYYIALSNDEKYQKKYIIKNERLSNVEAIRADNVYIMDHYQTSNPNHRSLDAILALGELLHRQVY